jgi:DNA-binding transcriptional LysR family regulator
VVRVAGRSVRLVISVSLAKDGQKPGRTSTGVALKESHAGQQWPFGYRLIIQVLQNRLFAMANNRGNPSIDDVSVFLAVLEAGGFRAAAKRLGLSASNVSETVSRLEALLGVPLLTRTTRNLMPTEAGRELADRVAPLLSEARAALHDAASTRQQVRGSLKLNVPGAVLPDILPPLIDRFLETHPGVKVELVVEDRLVDSIAAGCDAGIRYGEHLAQDMIAVPIGPRIQQLALAAAPSYLARRGIPTHPYDLLGHDCIRLRFSSGALVEWEMQQKEEVLTVDPPGRLIVGVTAADTAIAFARSGRGIIATFRNWLDVDLETGALQPVLQDWWQSFEGPYLYFSSIFMPAPLRAFVDMIAKADREPSA